MKRRWTVWALLVIGGAAGAGYFAFWNRSDGPSPFGAQGQARASNATLPSTSSALETAPSTPKEKPLSTVLQVKVSEELIEGFPKSVTVVDGDKQYKVDYTGNFIRMKQLLVFPIHLYAIASYVQAPKEGDTEALLDEMLVDGTPRVYLLRMLKTIPGKAVMNAIEEEINTYFVDVDMDKYGKDIQRFTAQFGNGATRDDIVYMVWLPGGRVFSGYNAPDKVQLVAQDLTLARAIWRIWAGEHSGPERVGLVERFATRSTNERK